MRYVRTVLILLLLALGATTAHATGPWFDPAGLQRTGTFMVPCDPVDLQKSGP